MGYAALLTDLCGDFVIAYESDNKEEVIDNLVNRGSAYIFYPLEFIIKYPVNFNGYVVEHPYEEFGFPKRFKIKTLLEVLNDICEKYENTKFTELEYLQKVGELLRNKRNKKRKRNK